ncbi:MAG: hypothetical protein IKA48_08315 [Fibrobacter sp.]|nr:hypothetical protein [Fibrobacter sp.]
MTKITRKEAQKAYDEGNPIMTDAEFDAAFAENSGALGTAGKVEHVQPMLSQKKCHSAGDVETFLLKLMRVHGEEAVFASLKLDGFACALRYRNGELVQALTRGDGHFGEDITDAIKAYVAPEYLPAHINSREDIEIRGEVILPPSQMQPQDAGKNPRNIATGMGMRKTITPDLRKLAFYAYDAVLPMPFLTRRERVMNLGFAWVPGVTMECMSAPRETIDVLAEILSNTDACADGIVFRAISRYTELLSKSTAHHPGYSIALKFTTKTAESEVVSIETTIGRTGRLTPVATIKPVHLDGATITSVSLGSVQCMIESGIHTGSRVIVTRQGGVVPKIIKVMNENN